MMEVGKLWGSKASAWPKASEKGYGIWRGHLNTPAHKLTGGTSSCGTTKVKNACGNLANNIRSREIKSREKLYAEMRHESHMLEEFVKKE